MKVIEPERTIEEERASSESPEYTEPEQLRFEAAPTRMTPGGTRTAVGYVRVSKEEEETQGYSFDTQRAEIERYCEREGYELIRIYADEGVSARSDRISKRSVEGGLQA